MSASTPLIFSAPNSVHASLRARIPARWVNARVDNPVVVVVGSWLDDFLRAHEQWPRGIWALHAIGHVELLVAKLCSADCTVWLGIDDNLWAMPGPLAPQLPPARLRGVEWALRRVHGVIASVPLLAEIVRAFNRNVRVIPNALPPAAELPLRPLRPPRGLRRIGVATAQGHTGNLDLLRAPLLGFLRTHRDVQAVFLGRDSDRLDWAHGHAQILLDRRVLDYPAHLARLAQWDLDLLLSPLAASSFNDAKSPTRALEAAVAGACLVASRIGPYRDCAHGETCWLVDDNSDAGWRVNLELLHARPHLVGDLTAAGRAWALATGTIETSGPLWAAAFGLPA